MSKWYLYIVQTEKEKLYTGITTDVERRFLEHLSGLKGAKYFRSDNPDKIVYVENCFNRSDASKREIAIKKLDRTAKMKIVNEFLGLVQNA